MYGVFVNVYGCGSGGVIQLEQCLPPGRTQMDYLRNASQFRPGGDCALSVEAAPICLGVARGGTGGQSDDVENPIDGISDHSLIQTRDRIVIASTCQVFRIRTHNLLTALLCQGAHKVGEHGMDMMNSEDSESEGCIGVPRHLGGKPLALKVLS